MLYDAAIIGTGPAGLSAALNLKIHNKSFVWFGSKSLSPKVIKAEQVFNYPGLPRITGSKLAEAYKRHIEDMGLEITELIVNSIMELSGHYGLTAQSEFYEAKTVLLATGVNVAGRLKGEERLLGKGVSYCATCDGMLYRGKTISVFTNSPEFEHEVDYLSEIAKKVYFFPKYEHKGTHKENVEICTTAPIEVIGDSRVNAIGLKDGSQIPIDGAFFLRNSIALSTLIPQIAMDGGHIAVNRRQETNLQGCYAAGDCTGRPYQYTKAVGEGNVAAHSMLEYLSEH